MKRGATGLCGVLAIDKPSGITSHDVVNGVRRLTGERRVGHAGTLDPMATGLMLVCVGAATRLSNYLTGHDKSYIARIVFGAATDTDDKEGRVVTAYTQSAPGEGLAQLSQADPQEVLSGLLGVQMQLPPAYSAIKKNGVTAYKAAREGKEIELEPRQVCIYKASLAGTGVEAVDLDDGAGGRFVSELPYWDVELAVSKGTYIRSIARDLGQQLGCGAHLSALRRVSVGDLEVENALSLEDLAAAALKGDLPWVDPVECLGYGTFHASQRQEADLSNGKALELDCQRASAYDEDELVSVVRGDKLLAVYKKEGTCLKPSSVIPGGVAGVAPRLWEWGDPAPSVRQAAVVAMGVFDGLHIGHRSLIDQAATDAASRGAQLVLVTFACDPDELLKPAGGSAFKLQTNRDRLCSLAQYVGGKQGIDSRLLALPVTAESLSQEAGSFLDQLWGGLDIKALHVGEGFRFGARAAGGTGLLDAYCSQHGASCIVHPLVESGGSVVSATRIRAAVTEDGDVSAAAALCGGRMHSITGTVVRGRGEGTDMGFATANLELPGAAGTAVPADGVYAGFARIGDAELALPAAICMGVAVSFEKATAEVEVHILGASGELYGQQVQIWFAKFLRPQRKFDDQAELIATVTRDIEWVRTNITPVASVSDFDLEGMAEY